VLLMLTVFFFSSRSRHTRCYRDWSSDVCSSDLSRRPAPTTSRSGAAGLPTTTPPAPRRGSEPDEAQLERNHPRASRPAPADGELDRKSVVEGKGVDVGGSRIVRAENRVSSKAT